MKNTFRSISFYTLFATALLWSCKAKDKVDPTLTVSAVEDYDLIQITNDSPNMPIVIAAEDDKGIDKIDVVATLDSDASKVVKSYINNITATTLNKTKVDVPFPLPISAPSGLYTVVYTITDKSGKTNSKSFKINVLNYRTEAPATCSFPNQGTPPVGKNVWFYVTTPSNTNGEELYVSGNFEGAVAGCSDWSGGGCAALKFTKVIGSTTCYYIALNLTAASEFKITRGSWSKVMKNADGSEADNIKWNNTASQNVTVVNWTDRLILPVSAIPVGAIKTGMITVVADVNTTDDSQPFYLIKKGTTAVSDANKMIRVVGTKKMAIAVAKEVNAEYVVVRNAATKTGINAYGFDKIFAIDGKVNPLNGSVKGFKTELTPSAVPATLIIVGGATPGGWGGSPAAQQFTAAVSNKFVLNSMAVTADGEYLLLPAFGDWNNKIGAAAGSNPLLGDLVSGGDNVKAPSVAGNYKIEIDFQAGTYKLTKL